MKNYLNLKWSVFIFLISFASFNIFAQSQETHYDPPGPTSWTLDCTMCSDNNDGDGDGLLDCEDPDCLADCGIVLCEKKCTDGIDNDGDGLIDGCDPNCTGTCYSRVSKYWK